MLRLIEHLLQLSTCGFETLELDCRPTDILSLIGQNLTLNQPFADSREIRLDVVADGPVPPIEVDHRMMDQVIDTLVLNAIRSSRSGSRIEIRAGTRLNAAVISLQAVGENSSASDRSLPRPGLREQGRGKQGPKGGVSGIALLMAERIVETHGGSLNLAGGKGPGFTLTLPVPGKAEVGVDVETGTFSQAG
jgi:NtrC-family two-component system sensor histidine kinase KinB